MRSPQRVLRSAGDVVTIFAALLCVGCYGVPVEVSRVVDPTAAEAKGIRYIVRYPRYVVSIRYNKVNKSETGAKDVKWDVLVEQKMDREVVYEARPFGHLLSETEVTIKQESDGRLTSFSAGETDRTAEYITALATIAATAGTKAAGDAMKSVHEADLKDFNDRIAKRMKKLADYKKEHLAFLDRQDKLDTLIKKLRDDLANGRVAGSYKEQIDTIVGLDTEFKRLSDEIKNHVFGLESNEFIVKIDGVNVFDPEDKDNVLREYPNMALLTIDLHKVR